MERQKRSWLTRRVKVELFEQIRRELEFGVGTIAGVSRKLGVHRRMVREAQRSVEPTASKPQRRRLRKLVDAAAFIGVTQLAGSGSGCARSYPALREASVPCAAM
jgi:hypothetical protein